MIKYEINPAFLARKAEIMALPVRFEQEGQIIYRGRNLIKIMTLDDLQINVKSFKRPHILNRLRRNVLTGMLYACWVWGSGHLPPLLIWFIRTQKG